MNEAPEEKTCVNKISTCRRNSLNSLLSNIRIKPQTRRDSLIIDQIKDNEAFISNSSYKGNYITSYATYGSSSKNNPDHSTSLSIECNNGRCYGQDYVSADFNKICLLDGHGASGERYSCYGGIYLPEIISKDYINTVLHSEQPNYDLIYNHFKNAFIKMNKDYEKYYNTYDRLGVKTCDIETAMSELGVGITSGTTCNYASIHCLQDKEGNKRRFIVSANIGDSETYSIWRYKTGNVRVKVHSGNHSVENIEESQILIDKFQGKVLSVLPIYNRFNSYDTKGNNRSKFPTEVTHHIDHIPNEQTFPIYRINKQKKLEVNTETLHKMNMAMGAYGRPYNIDQWFGGIHSIRSNTIEKKINGEWKAVAPIPDGQPVNFGSTPNGLCQNTRGFGDSKYKHTCHTPHVNIVEIPFDVHVTLICQSDGYGDVVHLSEVADTINKLPFNKPSQAILIREELIKLMYKNINGQEIRGYGLDNNKKPTWDDVSFGIIDSPCMDYLQ